MWKVWKEGAEGVDRVRTEGVDGGAEGCCMVVQEGAERCGMVWEGCGKRGVGRRRGKGGV